MNAGLRSAFLSKKRPSGKPLLMRWLLLTLIFFFFFSRNSSDEICVCQTDPDQISCYLMTTIPVGCFHNHSNSLITPQIC